MSGILQEFITGGVATSMCADVSIVPNSGTTPITITFSTTTPNAHIFFTKRNSLTGINPVHTGDNAGANTTRIGSNFGSTNVGAGNWTVRAVAYEPSHLDSNITEGDYDSGQ